MNNIEIEIKKCFLDTLSMHGGVLQGELNRDAVLLETGLDSLGFAILVSHLEQVLGYDPFTLELEAIYPKTYGEFVDLYIKHASHLRSDV